MSRPNDWFATLMYNNPSSFEEIVANGITPDNSSIKSADYYKEQPAVQEAFSKDGKFDEETFNNFYTSALNMYNQFSNEDWTNKIISDMAKDPFDWMQPLKTDVKDVSVTVGNGVNPERRSMGLTGMGTIGDPTFSIREIAQANYVRDEAGNKLDWTPDQRHGLIKSIFNPTVALAIYDDNGKHLENGVWVQHRKGDFKTDENGEFYYELLGDKESYGRELLKVTDTLTIDGTTLNKFDPFDSDGLSKSIGSTIAKTVVSIAPLLIPGVGEIYGTAGVFAGLAAVMPTFGKAINGMVSSITGTDSNNAVKQRLTNMENWFGRFGESLSDKGKSGFMNLENIANIMVSSAGQLYSQRQLAKLTNTLTKGGTQLFSSKFGQNLSLGWLAATSSRDAYADFKEAGASDAAAGIGMLAVTAALYEMMGMDYFRDQLFKGTFMDETESIDVMKNYVKEHLTKTEIAKTSEDVLENVRLFNKIKEGAKKAWEKAGTKWAWLGRKQQTLYNAGEEAAKKGGTKMWSTAGKILNRSANEGVEEIMEEVSSDLVKAMFLGAEALGIPVTAEKGKSLDFGYTPEEIAKRYAATFLGGALGGATFESIDLYNKHIGPKVVELSDKSSLQQMSYLIMTGHADEMRDRAKIMYEKGLFGNKNLSATETTHNSKGETIYKQGDENNNQNLWNYNAVLNQIDYLENILQNQGMMFKFMYQIDPETGLPKLNESGFEMTNEFRQELEKQRDVESKEGIDENEYTYRNKTNSLIKAVERFKQDTAYVNDMVELASDIIEAQSKIYLLQNDKVDTEENKPLKSEELKFWQDRLESLKKRRQDLVMGKNDDVYAHQALFVTQDSVHDPWMGGLVTGNNKIDDIFGNTYWIDSKEGFAKVNYGKNWSELNDSEKQIVEKKYNEAKASTGIDRLIHGAKTQYALLERSSDSIAKLDDQLKDRNLDTWFKHNMIAGLTSEFEQFENDQINLLKLTKEVQSLQEQKQQLESTYDAESLANNETYQNISEDLINKSSEIANINDRINAFNNKYGSYDEFVLNEALTDSGWDSFYSSIRSSYDTIDSINQEIGDRIIYNDISQKLEEAKTALSESEDPQEASSIENTIIDLETKKKIYEQSHPEQKNIGRLSIEKQSSYKNLLDSVTKFYTHLKANNIISENDKILKAVLNKIGENVLDDFETLFTDAASMAFGELEDSVAESLPEDDIKQKAKDYVVNLKNGHLEEALNVYDSLQNLIAENTSPEQAQKITQTLLTNVTVQQDLKTFLDNINQLKSGLLNFSVIDLVRGFELNVDDTVLKAIDVIEREQDNFDKSANKDSYLMDNPVYTKAMKQIPGLISMMKVIVDASYNGMNETLNAYRKRAKKDLLVSSLSESTKNIIGSDLAYLYGKTGYLIDLSEANAGNRKEFHRVSEIKIKTEFVKNLLFAAEAEDSISKKLQQLGLNLPELWKEAKNNNDIDLDHVNVENFRTFNSTFIKFVDSLYTNARPENIDHDERSKQIGEVLATLLPDDIYKMNAGEVTDNPEDNLTAYSTVMYLAAVLSLKPTDFFSNLKAVEFAEGAKFVPIIGQEWNIQLATSYSNDPIIFDCLAQEIKNKNDKYAKTLDAEVTKKYISGKSLLQHFMFVQGGLGSGKTSVIINYSNQILYNIYKDDYEAIFVGPHTTQTNNLKSLINGTDNQFILLNDLLEKVYPGYKNIARSKDLEHADQLAQENVTVKTKRDVLFKKDNSKKVIFIDEATFITESELQLLTAWAKQNNVQIIAVGDRKQNGVSNERGVTTGIEDCVFITGPELTESLRMANIAKARNIRSLSVPIKKTLNWYRNNPEKNNTEVDQFLTDVINTNKTADSAIKLQYYDVANSFVGDKFIDASDTERYIDKFINLSKEKRKNNELDEDKKPSVAVITDNDGGKWKDKGITIIGSAQVQGGEFDYVIIDKDFSKSGSKFNQIRDFYTLIGRSKYGTAIIGNEEFKNTFSIITSEVDSSVKDAPTSFADDASELIAWKKNSVEDITAVEISKPVEKTGTEGTKEQKNDTELTDDEKQILEAISSDFDKGDAAVANITSEDDSKADAESRASTQALIEAAKDADNKKPRAGSNNIKKRKINGKTHYDRSSFIRFVNSNVFIESEKNNEKSLLSLLGNNDSGERQLTNLVRNFSSAICFNMNLSSGNRTKLAEDSGVSREVIDAIVNQWQTEQNRTYFAKNKDNNSSIIYWQFKHKDKTYLIPIATVSSVLNGKLILSKDKPLFKQEVESLLIRSNEQIPLSTAVTHGKIFGEVRVFAPTDETKGLFGQNDDAKYRNQKFRENVGKTFIVWSESELVTDDDIADIFKYKMENGKRIYYIDAKQIPTARDTKTEPDYVYTLKNGTQVRLLNVHRELSLSKAYDIVNIMRFVLGTIPYEKLTQHQQKIIGVNDRIAGRNYLKTIFGNFTLNLATTSDSSEEKRILSENLQKLARDYKLMSSDREWYLLNGLYTSFRSLANKGHSDWLRSFTNNIFRQINQLPHEAKKIDTEVQMGLRVDFELDKKKTSPNWNSRQEYDNNHLSYWVRFAEDDNKNQFWEIYQYDTNKFTLGQFVDKIPAVGVDLPFDNIINAINKSSFNEGAKKSDTISNLLNSNRVVLRLLTHKTINKDNNSSRRQFFNEPSDYDLFGNTLNIANLNFNLLEEEFRKNNMFKYGIYLNDKGENYQVGNNRETNDSNKTAWRTVGIKSSEGLPIMSNIAEITSSAFSINSEYTFSEETGEPEEAPEVIVAPDADEVKGKEFIRINISEDAKLTKDSTSKYYTVVTPIKITADWQKQHSGIDGEYSDSELDKINESGTEIILKNGTRYNLSGDDIIDISRFSIDVSDDTEILKFKENLLSLLINYNVSDKINDLIEKYKNDDNAIEKIISELNEILPEEDLKLNQEKNPVLVKNQLKEYQVSLRNANIKFDSIQSTFKIQGVSDNRTLVKYNDGNESHYVVIRSDENKSVYSIDTEYANAIQIIHESELPEQDWIDAIDSGNVDQLNYLLGDEDVTYEVEKVIEKYITALENNKIGKQC